MQTIKGINEEVVELDELDFIRLELARVKTYYRHLKEYYSRMEAFLETSDAEDLWDWRKKYIAEASIEQRNELWYLENYKPKESKAYVKQALKNIRNLTLEYEAKI